jgi:hypothetical protein
MKRRLLLTLVAALTSLATSASAWASSSGTVTGKLSFYQFAGGYCDPAVQACAGARYQKSAYGTVQPIKETVVYVLDASDGTLLGSGASGTDGRFTVSWYSLENKPSFAAQIAWIGYGPSGSYYITKPTALYDSYLMKVGAYFTAPTNGTKDVGEVIYGSISGGNSIASLYQSLYLGYTSALKPSNRMVSSFTGVRVAAFGTFSECGASGSCADGDDKLIRIATDRAFEQGTAMHESGHIASYLSDGHKGAGNYCYPATSCTGTAATHSVFSDEWLAASFEEGFASIVAAVGLWAPNATAPRQCEGTGACTAGGALEISFNTTSCLTTNFRQEMQVTRFLWDLYDTNVDSTYGDNRNHSVSILYDILFRYTAGTGNHNKNEPWNSTLTTIDNYDGRGPDDFLFWTEDFLPDSTTIVSPTTMFTANCLKQ